MELHEIAKIGEIMDMRVGGLVARAKIERLLDADGFVIGHPTHRLVPLPIREKEPCDFWFVRDNGVFIFTAVLENEYTVGDLPFCAFKLITPVTRKQRRQAFRLQISMDATIRVSDKKTRHIEEIQVRTIDISQTGVMIRTDRSMETGARFTVCLDLYHDEILCLNATVTRVEPAAKKRGAYRVAARFEWSGNQDSSVLYRYILNKQIMRRRAIKNSE